MPPRKKVEPVGPPPDGFAAAPGKVDEFVAVGDIHVSFIPRNAQRESTILLFPKGQTISRKGYEHRMGMYAGYTSMEVK